MQSAEAGSYAGWSDISAASGQLHQILDAIPGRQFRSSAGEVIWRYIKTSHQDDPFRTVLELLLVFFVIRTWLQSRTRAEGRQGNFVKLSEKEIDDLVKEWQPEPLAPSISAAEAALTPPPTIIGTPGLHAKVVVPGSSAASTSSGGKEESKERSVLNLASANFAGLYNNEAIKEKAIECMRGYGVGSCGPPGFYGTFDVHIELERAIARFLGVGGCIIYAQAFSTPPSVLPCFSKRGDVIVADRGVNFALQKGIQISRSNVRWYDHNNLDSLESVLETIQREDRKYRRPLTRRFIVTEALFENDGELLDLPKLIEIKRKYKYRLILDESCSIGILGQTGRGITELYDVAPHEVDIVLGSMANSFCSAGGFCAGTKDMVAHQRINSASVVFSAALPPMLAVASTEAINHLSRPSPTGAYPLDTLPENVRTVRSTLEKAAADGQTIELLSHPLSPFIHLAISRSRAKDVSREEQDRLLQEIVDESLANGVLLTRAKRVWEQEMVASGDGARPTIRICVSAALAKKDLEKAATTIRQAAQKALGRRKS